jgi:GNAT superfamily N-acetyltransferase
MKTPEKLTKNGISISTLHQSDIPLLDTILRQFVRDRDTGEILEKEISEIKQYMGGNLDKHDRSRQYLVARNQEGKPIACMAWTTQPDPDMITHFTPLLDDISLAAEPLNAFVDSQYHHLGVATALFNAICDQAYSQGFKYIIANSGTRYQRNHPWHDSVTDKRCGYIKEKYGPGGDAMTWIKYLQPKSI